MNIFYHIACMGIWEQVVPEQLHLIKQSGFDAIKAGVLCSKDQLPVLESIARKSGVTLEVVHYAEDYGLFEHPTIACLQQWCRTTNDEFVMYLHTKAVTVPDNLGRQDSRKLMQLLLLQNLKHLQDILRLRDYHACGFNWVNYNNVFPHFRGNFWMAKCEYIRNLPDFYEFAKTVPDYRVAAEYWIGSGNPKTLSLGVRQNPSTYETQVCTELLQQYRHGRLPLVAK